MVALSPAPLTRFQNKINSFFFCIITRCMICEVRKNLCQKNLQTKKGNKILMILKVKAEMSEAFCIARVFGLNNTLCMCTYTCVCRRGIFACLLTGKVLLRLCVLHNSVVREYNLYMRHSFHPCSLHFIS